MKLEGFVSEIWRVNVTNLFGEKANFFDSLRTTEISGILKLSVYVDIVLLNFSKYFQNNLNHCSAQIIREVMKFCNPADQSFET